MSVGLFCVWIGLVGLYAQMLQDLMKKQASDSPGIHISKETYQRTEKTCQHAKDTDQRTKEINKDEASDASSPPWTKN